MYLIVFSVNLKENERKFKSRAYYINVALKLSDYQAVGQ